MIRKIPNLMLITLLTISIVACHQTNITSPEEKTSPSKSQYSPELSNTQNSSEKHTPLQTTSHSPHPVSLQALSTKEFDGRELTFISTLADNQWYTRYRIAYKSGPYDISGVMNVPKGEGPFPILILNHGYIDPSVYTNGRGLKREQDYFARANYVVVHPDYRNHAYSSTVEDSHLKLRIDYSEDVINLIYALKESQLKYLDKNHIGMLGHSMGGGITMNIAVARPDLIQAVVLYAPVSADYRQNFEKWTRNRTEQANSIIEAYGEPVASNSFWDNISPLSFIDQISSPILIHHGTADDSCPLEWSNTLTKKLEEAGKEVTYFTYEAAPHEFIKNWSQFMRRNREFFDTKLRK